MLKCNKSISVKYFVIAVLLCLITYLSLNIFDCNLISKSESTNQEIVNSEIALLGYFSQSDNDYINPKVIETLLINSTNLPMTGSSIDLSAAVESVDYKVDVLKKDVEQVTLIDKPLIGYNRASGFGAFYYTHIGTSPSGIHILLTMDHGGGSGVYMAIIFVSTRLNNILAGSANGIVRKNRVMLDTSGVIRLGDRYSGEVTYLNGILTIGKDESHMKHGHWLSTQQFQLM